MELLVALGVLAVLGVLLVVTSVRYGRPRLNMRPVMALWIVAVLFALLLLWLAFD